MSDVYRSQVESGELNRRIVIEKPAQTNDDLGHRLDWTGDPLATVWAKVDELSGNEAFRSLQHLAIGLTRFTIRYRTDITLICRILYSDRIYDITSITRIGAREGLGILASYQAE